MCCIATSLQKWVEYSFISLLWGNSKVYCISKVTAQTGITSLKKKENKPQNYPCFRDSSHVLCHATVWKGFLSTFLPMQGPTTQRQSKAQPEFTQPSSHVLHLLLLLSPPGWDKIDRWTFLKPLLEGKHLSCTCNELRTKQEWHPAQLLNYHSVK